MQKKEAIKVLNNNSIHEAIRANNLVYELMYYNELINEPNYQLTWMEEADLAYYNCAQAIDRFSPQLVKEVEDFYNKKGLQPAFYIDPDSPKELLNHLKENGYREIQNEEESWQYLDLTTIQDDIDPKQYLKIDPKTVTVVEVKPEGDYFDEFIRIDSECNELTPEISANLKRNLTEKQAEEVKNTLFLCLVDRVPVATASVGINNEIAIFAEGATLPDYRRKGLYTYLLAKSVEHSISNGAKKAYLIAEIDAYSNATSQKVGFKHAFNRQYWQKFNKNKNDVVDNFINSIPERRKIIMDFCNQNPMYGIIIKKVEGRYIEDVNNNWFYDFSTQDYLGFSFNKEQIEATNVSNYQYGTVIAWCRLIATVDVLRNAEIKLAKLLGTEDVSIFASTTLVNHGMIPALMGGEGTMFLDKSAHATMYEGCKIARDSGAKLVSFPTNDERALAKLLSKCDDKKKLILVDGVYSMNGNYADLPMLDKLAKEHNALLYVDDAHGFGVIGENPTPSNPLGEKGNGLVKYYNLDYENILYVGCFSKAYGTFGAFVTCSKKLHKFILSQATPHDLGGAGPASALSALVKGLDLNVKFGANKRKTMSDLTSSLTKELINLGFTLDKDTNFPIVYIKIPNIKDLISASKILFSNNILATPSPYPMVKHEEQGIRITITSINTIEQIKHLINVFKLIKDKCNV